MTITIRSFIAAGLLAGAFAIAAPQNALAQGKSQKAAKAENKLEKKIDKRVTKSTQARSRLATRRARSVSYPRLLCEDGVWVTRNRGCVGHGGIATRQGPEGGYPHASARARARANANSAVIRGIGANNVRTNAIARCNDGSYWHATTRDNACYLHGGVATWL
jgi:hypothetical protein